MLEVDNQPIVARSSEVAMVNRGRYTQDLLQQHIGVARQAVLYSQERGVYARNDAQTHQRAFHELQAAAAQVVGQQAQAISQAKQSVVQLHDMSQQEKEVVNRLHAAEMAHSSHIDHVASGADAVSRNLRSDLGNSIAMLGIT